jgi:hypothetical protein
MSGAEMSWIGCDICQTWYHQKCVRNQIRHGLEPEYICSKCSREDFKILTHHPMSKSEQVMMGTTFQKIKMSKHIWPIKKYNLSHQVGADLSIIEQKLKNEEYRWFKEYMDEMIMTISAYRDHYSPQSPSINTKREIKCCEIVEYEFSNHIRDYISNHRQQVVHQVQQRLPRIQRTEDRIQASLSSSST